MLQELQQRQDEKAREKEEQEQARHDRLMGLTPKVPVAPSRLSEGVAPSPRRRQMRSISSASYSQLMGTPMPGDAEGEILCSRVTTLHGCALTYEAVKQTRWRRNCGGVLLLNLRSLSSQLSARRPVKAGTRARRAPVTPTVRQLRSSVWGKCAAGSARSAMGCTSTGRHPRWTVRRAQLSRRLMSR